MRCGLEMVSARLAAERATDGELTELFNFWHKVCLDYQKYAALQAVECDETFHERVALLSHNAKPLKTLKNIRPVGKQDWVENRIFQFFSTPIYAASK